MRARVVLLLSLGLNLVLVGMIVFLSRESEQLLATQSYVITDPDAVSERVRTHVVVRRRPVTWADIESAEYPEYIANLRLLGCPEKTIRDIIVADVEELYRQRIRREVVYPDQQWWKPDPNQAARQAVADQVRALDQEKRQLLTHLLGPGWEAPLPEPGGEMIRLDGPVLSALSEEVKQEVYRIIGNAYAAEQQLHAEGRAGHPAAINDLRQQTRAELARVLTPLQLEEYLLRYSATSQQLREQLREFDTGPEEFRRIFRAMDPYQQQIAALDQADPATASRQAELERRRDASIRQELGTDRFTEYQLHANPLFRAALQEAERHGGPPEAVLPIFEVNQLARQEIARIQGDASLSEEDRITALRSVQDQRQNSINRIIQGAPAPEPPLPQPTDE